MTSRQARIFVPSTEVFDNWVETLLGKVIRPIVNKHNANIEWFWFSRYLSMTTGASADTGDCDFAAIPDSFKEPLAPGDPPMHRSVRLRYELDSALIQQFESDLKAEAIRHGYGISGCLDYVLVGDLGGDRFNGNEHRAGSGPAERAKLVAGALMALSRIVLDALVGPDAIGRYRMELNDNDQNPHGSSFESLHHMFCNITNPPLFVDLNQAPNSAHLFLGTAWTPTPPGMVPIAKLPIRF